MTYSKSIHSLEELLGWNFSSTLRHGGRSQYPHDETIAEIIVGMNQIKQRAAMAYDNSEVDFSLREASNQLFHKIGGAVWQGPDADPGVDWVSDDFMLSYHVPDEQEELEELFFELISVQFGQYKRNYKNNQKNSKDKAARSGTDEANMGKANGTNERQSGLMYQPPPKLTELSDQQYSPVPPPQAQMLQRISQPAMSQHSIEKTGPNKRQISIDGTTAIKRVHLAEEGLKEGNRDHLQHSLTNPTAGDQGAPVGEASFQSRDYMMTAQPSTLDSTTCTSRQGDATQKKDTNVKSAESEGGYTMTGLTDHVPHDDLYEVSPQPGSQRLSPIDSSEQDLDDDSVGSDHSQERLASVDLQDDSSSLVTRKAYNTGEGNDQFIKGAVHRPWNEALPEAGENKIISLFRPFRDPKTFVPTEKILDMLLRTTFKLLCGGSKGYMVTLARCWSAELIIARAELALQARKLLLNQCIDEMSYTGEGPDIYQPLTDIVICRESQNAGYDTFLKCLREIDDGEKEHIIPILVRGSME